MIDKYIKALVCYGIEKKLILKDEVVYSRNLLLYLLNLNSFTDIELEEKIPLDEILNRITTYAFENNIIKSLNFIDTDLFESKLMNAIMPRPSTVINEFRKLYGITPKKATDYYYKFSKDSNYINRYRICKNKTWKINTEYGNFDMSINLSKPEKDPKIITLINNFNKIDYPQCFLCRENEGYSGNESHPGRQNHRMIPIKLNENNWYFQYSPYVYYNEHCIVLSEKHEKMEINRNTFKDIIDFIEKFPHYFLGSNAGLPIVGGSILNHKHYQGGRNSFGLNKALIEKEIKTRKFKNSEIGIVKWPMSVIRVRSSCKEELVEISSEILNKWEKYSDKSVSIISETNGKKHNTVTPIGRKTEDVFEMDIILRNNITTKERPYGLFHPRNEYHNIKKENIGLIEALGLAVLPSRLKKEMETLEYYILNNKDILSNENISKHYNWVNGFIDKYEINENNINKILRDEIGNTFCKILEDTGVFKRDINGTKAFLKFIDTLNI